MLKEFKEFAMRGNLVDIAVAFVMGAAFNRVVTSFTGGLVSPLVGMLTGKDLSQNKWVIKEEVKDATGTVTEPEVALLWGKFSYVDYRFYYCRFRNVYDYKRNQRLKEKGTANATGGNARRHSSAS